MKDRILNQDLMERIMSAEEAAMLIKDGMIFGTSGFTPSGHPKALEKALAQLKEKGVRLIDERPIWCWWS